MNAPQLLSELDVRIAALAIISILPERKGRRLSKEPRSTVEKFPDYNVLALRVEYALGPTVVMYFYLVFDFSKREFNSCLFHAVVELDCWGEVGRRVEVDREMLVSIKRQLPCAIVSRDVYDEVMPVAQEAGILTG